MTAPNDIPPKPEPPDWPYYNEALSPGMLALLTIAAITFVLGTGVGYLVCWLWH